MFRFKRQDTQVGTIEDCYGIDLNARRNMLLGTLLRSRGFDSLTQFIKATRGRLFYHPCPRKVFLSFHHEDLRQVSGFRLMTKNPKLNLEISDDENRYPVDSTHAGYVKRAIRAKIRSVDVVVCMIGNGTAWRDWVDWELKAAEQENVGICGVRLKGARSRAPEGLRNRNASVARWNLMEITAAIERAAALRS